MQMNRLRSSFDIGALPGRNDINALQPAFEAASASERSKCEFYK